MPVKITYFVHGTTTDNEQGIATGWLPGRLSEKGIAQVKQLRETIKDEQYDVAFCSDLQRAIESADIMFHNKTEVIADARIRECNYGDNNGKQAKIFKYNLVDFIDVPFPDGESYKDVELRLASFIEHLQIHYNNQHIAIVSHQAPQLALDVLLKGKTWQEAINEDWRKTKSWQPGWEYLVS